MTKLEKGWILLCLAAAGGIYIGLAVNDYTGMTLTRVATDANRWWAVMAGTLCLNGLWLEWRGKVEPCDRLPHTYRMATLGLSLFVVPMGSLLPMFTPFRELAMMLYPAVAAACWWFLAVAIWAMASRYCERLSRARFVSPAALFVVTALSAAMHVG